MRCLPLVFVLVLAACGAESTASRSVPSSPFVRVSRPVMGTEAHVVLYARDPKAAFDAAQAALDEIQRLENVLSDYDPESELMRLCAAEHDEPVPVSRDLYDALSLALDFARRTGGVYDPTVGAYTHLWREARKTGARPSDEALAEARTRVGWQKVEMHPPTRSVRFTVKGLQLDLGGFGKGYAAQAAWAMLGIAGFPQCLVDVGGDIVVGAPPEGQEGWRVALEDGTAVRVHDCAIAGSGPGDRAIEIGDVRYGHILDPRTGVGITTGARSTVIAPDAASADVFATVLCILPVEAGIATAEGTSGVEARVKLTGQPEQTTSGFARYRIP